MAIQDIAHNPLPNGTQGQMLGYVEPVTAAEVLSLRIYKFIIDQIRIEDAKPAGALFLKRFLEGPQLIWEDTQARIFSIKDLWNLNKIADEHLQYLKNIVGWTGNLETITDRLEYSTLRKLIGASIPLWKQRGTDDALQDVITLVTGARNRVWDWFDYRWVLDETEMGEEHEGRDPWVIDLPGPPTLDEYRSNLRVVDDGNLDRTLVQELVKLMRAIGERWEISYIDFLDRFIIDGDDTQWYLTTETIPTIEGGVAKLSDDTIAEKAVVSLEQAPDWTEYVAYFRIRGESQLVSSDFGAIFYWTDSNNYYSAVLDTAAQTVALKKVVGGVPATIASVAFPLLAPNVWYGLRVQITREGSTNRIKVFVDADLYIDTTDSGLLKGSLGFLHTANVAGVELDEIEMFQLPLDTVLIDINPG